MKTKKKTGWAGALKWQIINLLCISEETYATTVEQLGRDFAWHYTGHDEESVRYLILSAGYWEWWKKQWLTRDEEFLEEYGSYQGAGGENELMDLWLDHHAPAQVAGYPNRYILEQSYQLMVEEIKKEQ